MYTSGEYFGHLIYFSVHRIASADVITVIITKKITPRRTIIWKVFFVKDWPNKVCLPTQKRKILLRVRLPTCGPTTLFTESLHYMYKRYDDFYDKSVLIVRRSELTERWGCFPWKKLFNFRGLLHSWWWVDFGV